MSSHLEFANYEVPLSGRILNCVTQLPNRIFKNASGEWEVAPASGNSALYSSNKFLVSETDWETHLIGWTGELDPNIASSTEEASGEIFVETNGDVNMLKNEDPLYLDHFDKAQITHKIRAQNQCSNIHPVWLLRRDQERWRKYAENVLWPAFHYILNQPTNGKQEAEWWYDYVKFNEAYAARVLKMYRPGDVIWVHDYYLMLLPSLIRMQVPDATVGFFLHAPFPSSEYFRCIPKRQQLLDGLLGANKVTFQSQSFARHFISSCKRLLGTEGTPSSVSVYGGNVLVDSLPIGVDVSGLLSDAFTAPVEEKIAAIRASHAGKKIIVGRDRLDTVHGVVQKLQAFEMFLDMYPEWRDQCVLIQVSSPSFSSHEIEQQVNELVANINTKYGDLEHVPVQHYHTRLPRETYLSLLRAADLGLSTSIRDGVNTSAMEFVTVQRDQCSPLILSEFSGTATILQDSVIVNPWDSVAVAKQINECLNYSEESKKLLQEKLNGQVPTIQDWTLTYLTRLITDIRGDTKVTPALNRPLLYKNYKSAKRRLFLFDYDGTLTPIVKDPAAAIPSARLFSILDKLSKDPLNQIWIISGRDQQFLSHWLGEKNSKLGLSAEHGCFMKDIDDSWANLAEKFDMSWQKIVGDVMQHFTDKTPGSFIERKKVALTWHYRRADPELGEFNAQLCKQALLDACEGLELEVMSGKANIEVRPKFVNKGEIVRRLVLHTFGAKQSKDAVFHPDPNVTRDHQPDFILCLGDDQTDEDMFGMLNEIEQQWEGEDRNEYGNFGIYPVTVGPASKKTVAKAHLADPHQVLDTLGLLVDEVSLFETAGTVELDDRGHVLDSESSLKSKAAVAAAAEKRRG